MMSGDFQNLKIKILRSLLLHSGFTNCVLVASKGLVRSHEKAIFPFHFRSNFWNRQIGCSRGNGTITYQFCFVFRRERYRSVDMFSICLVRRERNNCVSLSFSYHFFGPSSFCNGTVLFEVCQCERNPSAFHFLEQYGTKWNDYVLV